MVRQVIRRFRRLPGGVRLTFVVLLASLGAASQGLRAQDPDQGPTVTFRSAVEAVEVDVYVTDEDGNPVAGLAADDFELFEDGVPQPITTFEAVDIPVETIDRVEAALAEPDVLTNNRPEGRLYVLALDDVTNENILHTRRLARQFVEQYLGPNDVAAVTLVGQGLATDGQDFTSNRQLLLEAIENFRGAAPPIDIEGARGGGGPANQSTINSLGAARSQAQSLRALTELMARMPGRHKAMLFFTTEIGVDVYDLIDYNGGVLSLAGEEAHAAMAAATRSNLAIYPINPGGLNAEGSVPLEMIGRYHAMAEATGGVALVNSSSFSPLFERIVRDNSTYYMLGFNSGYMKEDGRYVPIEVRVKRSGLVVRTRGGYVAPTRAERRARERERNRETPPPSAASAALASPLATDGLPMRVFATPFRRDKDDALVALALELDASTLELEVENGAYVGEVDVSYLATDARRKIYPQRRHTASIRIESEADELPPLESVRVRVLTEIELDKGRYQLRVGSSTDIRTGGVVYDLEVPDFSDGELTMSGLALVSPSERLVLTLQADRRDRTVTSTVKCYRERCSAPLARAAGLTRAAQAATSYLDGRLPGPPTTAREFALGDQVTLALEVYDNRRVRRNVPPHTIALAVSLWSSDGQIIPLVSEERSAAAAVKSSGVHAFALPLPLTRVRAGAHTLRVEATSSAGEGFTTMREIPIRIR